MSMVKRTVNWSPFTQGPSTPVLLMVWALAHHSPLAAAAALPWLAGSIPGGPPASMLTTSSAQYFSPGVLKSPVLQMATRSLAISVTDIAASLACGDDYAPES